MIEEDSVLSSNASSASDSSISYEIEQAQVNEDVTQKRRKSQRDDECALSGKKKARPSKSLTSMQKLPSSRELTDIKETKNSFHSNLFKLQVGIFFINVFGLNNMKCVSTRLHFFESLNMSNCCRKYHCFLKTLSYYIHSLNNSRLQEMMTSYF